MNAVTRVYIDFDGTITKGDVGNAFFRTFGGEQCDQLVAHYRAGVISAQDLFLGEAKYVGRLDTGAFTTFVAAQEIDPTFSEFIGYCRARTIETTILSDGLDLYITPILERHGLGDVAFFSNRCALVGPDKKLVLDFPHANAECERCACCKRNIMLTRSAEDDVLVYIGEGYSDRCPAQYADVVFAKDALQTFCQEENISYHPYLSFRDVRRALEQLSLHGHLRKMYRAEVRRREVFIREA